MKDYLRDRGLKHSGRKAELVALAYGASQMNVSCKPTAIEKREKNRHEYKKLLKITDKDVIPDPLTLTGWIPEQTGISQWPPTMYFDIAEYLNPNFPSFGDLKRCLMTDYKERKLYTYFDSKFHNIQ